jgi:putative DNA primase/helicase
MAKFRIDDFQFSETAGLRVKHAQRAGMRLLAEVGILSHGKEVYREALDLNNGDQRYRLAQSANSMHPGDWETWLAGAAIQVGDAVEASPRKRQRTPKDPVEPASDEAPRLDAGRKDIADLASETWSALQHYNDPPTLFRRGAERLRLIHTPFMTEALTADRLLYELGRAASWFKIDKATGQSLPALVPAHVVKDLLASPEVPLPELSRITRVPVFAPDGSLQTQAGYHPRSHTYFYPEAGLSLREVPEHPGDDDVAAAKAALHRIMQDFPFVATSDKAHALAYVLLPFARDLIDGPTPLHLFEAPTPGTGKGLLAESLTMVALGDAYELTSELESNAEWRKTITTLLHQSRPVIWIDNVRHKLDASSLAKALTDPVWSDRLLGSNTSVSIPVRCVWLATGNNVRMSDELSRRTIRIRMDARVDRPWLRQGFAIGNLRQYVRQHRGELIWACLTLIQHWIAQGQPVPSCTPLGSYERWSSVIGGILESAGVHGFLEDMEEFYANADADSTPARDFVNQWFARYGNATMMAKDLLDIAVGIDGLELRGHSDRAIRVSLGIMVSGLKDRVFGGLRVTSVGESHRAGLWKIEKVADETGESTNLDESLNAGARKNRREKNSESLHRDSPDSLDSPHSLAPHKNPPNDTDSDGGVNDGCWERVMETAGRVSPDVDDMPPLDNIYADALVKHGDDNYEEDTV